MIAGGVLQFWLYVVVLRGWSASATSYMLVLIPIVVVALGAWFLDERLTWTFALGAILVLVGVYVGAIRGRVDT